MSDIHDIKSWTDEHLAECLNDEDGLCEAKFAERRRRAKERKAEEERRRAEAEAAAAAAKTRRKEAEEKAQHEAEEKARREAEEKARREAEAAAKRRVSDHVTCGLLTLMITGRKGPGGAELRSVRAVYGPGARVPTRAWQVEVVHALPGGEEQVREGRGRGGSEAGAPEEVSGGGVA